MERKIQLTLAPPPKQPNNDESQQKQEAVSPTNDDKNFTKEHIIIARAKPPTQEASRGFKTYE